jgi:bifunctional DNA-binding transcriptional regulator/antitoxin component of YhaV-PrlF toxin-antitoxin module
MSEVESVEETTVSTSLLTGKALLRKVKELSHLPKREIATQSGYVKNTKSGDIRTDLSGFYDAVLTAKGVKLNETSRDNRGKTATYKATVNKDGQLSIGAAYTKQMGLKEGDVFEISLGYKHIHLKQIDRDETNNSPEISQQERLELATHLKSLQNNSERWDLSEAAIAKRNAEMRQVLAEWRETGNEEEQTETWEELRVSLDLDRLSSNRPFFPAE